MIKVNKNKAVLEAFVASIQQYKINADGQLLSDIPNCRSEDLTLFLETFHHFLDTLEEATTYALENINDGMYVYIEPSEKTVELIKSLNHAGSSSINDMALDVYEGGRYGSSHTMADFSKFLAKAESAILNIESIARKILFMFLNGNYYNIEINNKVETHLFLGVDALHKKFKVFNVTTKRGYYEGTKNGAFKLNLSGDSLFDVITHHRLYNISLVHSKRTQREIYNLIDLAIDTNDKVWFNELVEELNNGESIRTT